MFLRYEWEKVGMRASPVTYGFDTDKEADTAVGRHHLSHNIKLSMYNHIFTEYQASMVTNYFTCCLPINCGTIR